MAKCPIHKRDLICPKCMGAKGGKRTGAVHGDKLGIWAARGRRARRRNARQSKKAAGSPAAS